MSLRRFSSRLWNEGVTYEDINMKKSAIIIGAVVIIALLVFGILEKTLSGTVGNLGVIIMYSIVAIILAVLYVRASRQAKEEEEKLRKEHPELFEEETED